MSVFVLDCSVVMGWVSIDEKDGYSMKVLDSLDNSSAAVPHLWSYEVSNVFLTELKRKRLTEIEVLKHIYDLNQLSIEIDNSTPHINDLFVLGQKYGLTAYDASYLQLCLTRGLPLATKDKKLMQAVVEAGGELYLQ